MVLSHRSADKRALREGSPQSVNDRAHALGRWVLLGDGLHQGEPARPALRRRDLGDARIVLSQVAHAGHLPGGSHDLERPRGAGAERALNLVVALARVVATR